MLNFWKNFQEASIRVDENQVSQPVINGQTLHNIQEIISQQLGVDLNY